MTAILPAALRAASLLTALVSAPVARADTILSGNHSIEGMLCVGPYCGTESYDDEVVLKLDEDSGLGILFQDIGSTMTGGPDPTPYPDWFLVANHSHSFSFGLQDLSTGNLVMRVSSGAPASSLTVDNTGRVGLGTILPQRDLHIVDGVAPTIRFERNGSAGWTPQTWDIAADSTGLYFNDMTHAKTHMLVTPFGWFGFGTANPAATMHFQRSDGQTQFLVEEVSTTTSPRALLNLQNNGRPEIVMGNSSTGSEWSFGAGTNFVLKQGAIGSDSSAKTKLFEIAPTGNAILAGSLTTGGTTCGSGCDAVFEDDYPLPSIAEHAARMTALGHLPNVGPTPEGAPIDLTDKLGRMLNELEHAHLYIAELETRDRNRQAEIAALRSAHAARIAALEARLAAPHPRAD